MENTSKNDVAVCLDQVGKKFNLKFGVQTLSLFNSNEFWALQDISFSISRGTVLGVIGRNGAGKTTLLNIISQTLQPSTGSVKTFGKVVCLSNLGVGFQDELNGLENIMLNGALIGATQAELRLKTDEIIDFSELGEFIHMPVGSYSQGMRLRLAFSIIANIDFDCLVLDEVLMVGDPVFQNKCFQRLILFKQLGRTLIITSQNLDVVERLSDIILVLDHGKNIFCGEPFVALQKYRQLLEKEEFFVGPQHNSFVLKDTLKNADANALWGKTFGTKEVVIDSVRLENKFGFRVKHIPVGGFLKIKVSFLALIEVRKPHFGIAIFRDDRVYCYGPNTKFDGLNIDVIKKGKGEFVLEIPQVLLAPGKFKISVAVWDEKETIAFDYHDGCYDLEISGIVSFSNQLTAIPYFVTPKLGGVLKNSIQVVNDKVQMETCICNQLKGISGTQILQTFDKAGIIKSEFFTSECLTIVVSSDVAMHTGDCTVGLGVFRDDGVFCQGALLPMKLAMKQQHTITFPVASFLPGRYFLSLGYLNNDKRLLQFCSHYKKEFNMIFDRSDHGTVYLPHAWYWRCL